VRAGRRKSDLLIGGGEVGLEREGWLIFFFSRKNAHSLKSTVSMHAAKLWVIMENCFIVNMGLPPFRIRTPI
jgi:hypothetical protein